MALMLKRRGITRVRPLAGGLLAWKEKGYPLDVRQTAPKDTALEQTAETA